MSILACYNIKGGVGKTTTAVNLAYLSAKNGQRTVLWDLDLQSSAGFFLSARKPSSKSIKLFTNGKESLKDNLQPTDFEHLFLLPSDFSLNKIERVLDGEQKSRQKFAQTLKRLKKKFDRIVLDCPPGFSLLNRSIIQSATVIVTPVLPNPLALENLDILRQRVRKNAPKDLLLFPFFSMVDRRKQLHRDLVGLHVNGKRGFLNSNIPYASQIERMSVEKAPVGVFSPRSNAAKAYKSLYEEINSNIELYKRVKKIKMW